MDGTPSEVLFNPAAQPMIERYGLSFRPTLMMLSLGGILLQSVAPGAIAGEEASSIAGRRMFFGELPVQGAILGNPDPLPSGMVACANCHLDDSGAQSGASFAPPLNRPTMTELRRRRGGPLSVFSPTTFCRILRTGVDPTYIVITRRMPRYILRDDQCLDLWRYLLEVNDAHKKE